MAEQDTDPNGFETRSSSKEFEHLLKDLYFRLDERDRWSDHAIRYLLYGNGGGVALTIGLIGAFARYGIDARPLWLAIAPFLVGICLVGFAVYHSASCATKGRNGFRELIESYLDDAQTTYLDVFKALPHLPSKSALLESLCVASFGMFITGTILAAYLASSIEPVQQALQLP